MVFSAPSDGKAKKPQTPEFDTEDELLSTPEGQKKLQILASESYARWATNQLQAVEPKKEDYVVTVDVPRDPQNPASEVVTRIVRNPDGSPKLDEKAFAKAHTEFVTQMAEGKDDESFAQLAADRTILNQKRTMGSLDPVMRQKGVGKGKALEYRLDEISYEQARNQAVKATTDTLKKEGVLLGGASGAGHKKGAIGPTATAPKAVKHTADPNANFGAVNVLKTQTGPGIDKNGNAVQAPVLPIKGVDGEYTVLYKPAEVEKESDDFETLLDETNKGVQGSVTYGQGSGPPAAVQVGAKTPAAPAPVPAAISGANGTLQDSSARRPANNGDDSKNFLQSSPYNNGSPSENGTYGDPSSASKLQQPDQTPESQ
jgi:hypothetical protein